MSVRFGTHQNVAYTDTAGVITNAIGSGVFKVLVTTTSAAHIAIGASPTADTDDPYIAADEAIELTVNPGEKVSAVRATTTSGTLHVTELD